MSTPLKIDSSTETSQHIAAVEHYLEQIIHELIERLATHDVSKLHDPEKAAFDRFTPMARNITYGSATYKLRLEEMKDALEHHYAHNRHHPEHFPNGIEDMTLVDLIEMMADWKGASMRHTDGNIYRSISVGTERFHIGDQLASILRNTAREMGWD